MMTSRRPEDEELMALLAQLGGQPGGDPSDSGIAPSRNEIVPPPIAAGDVPSAPTDPMAFFPPEQVNPDQKRQEAMASMARGMAEAAQKRAATRQRTQSIAMGAMAMSDPAMKDHVAPANTDAVLRAVERLPVSTWSYKGDSAKHIGPMAPDFRRGVGVGDRDDAIHVVDGMGSALAAIQALARRLRRLEGRQ